MHFAVIGPHRDVYRKQGWIEFSEVLTAAQCQQFLTESHAIISTRLSAPPQRTAFTPADRLFKAGRDLWRDAHALKKITLQKDFGHIASEIVERKPLRFGYSQLLTGWSGDLPPTSLLSILASKTPSLNEISGIQDVLCGALLCLAGPGPSLEQPEASTLAAPATLAKPSFPATPSTPHPDPTNPDLLIIPKTSEAFFTLTPGNAIFFSPKLPIPFDVLAKRSGCEYLLLTYVTSKAVFCAQELDPMPGEFKKIGYNYGDRLKETLNPLIYQ